MSKARKSAVAAAVERSIEATALRPDVAIAAEMASTVAPQLTKAVMATPEMQFATNKEPWFQSYVIVGSLVTLVAGSYGLVLDFTDGTLPTVADLTPQLAGIFGAGVALYGRWFATKPIGG